MISTWAAITPRAGLSRWYRRKEKKERKKKLDFSVELVGKTGKRPGIGQNGGNTHTHTYTTHEKERRASRGRRHSAFQRWRGPHNTHTQTLRRRGKRKKEKKRKECRFILSWRLPTSSFFFFIIVLVFSSRPLETGGARVFVSRTVVRRATRRLIVLFGHLHHPSDRSTQYLLPVLRSSRLGQEGEKRLGQKTLVVLSVLSARMEKAEQRATNNNGFIGVICSSTLRARENGAQQKEREREKSEPYGFLLGAAPASLFLFFFVMLAQHRVVFVAYYETHTQAGRHVGFSFRSFCPSSLLSLGS